MMWTLPQQAPPTPLLSDLSSLVLKPRLQRRFTPPHANFGYDAEFPSWISEQQNLNGTKSSSQEYQLTVPQVQQDTDWREFRAQLVHQNEHSTTNKGTEDSNNSQVDYEKNQFGQQQQKRWVGGQGQGQQQGGKVWAHRISAPEAGCILLAHPCMFQSSQDYFQYSVVFIVSHNENGSVGLVLNKPYPGTLKDIQSHKNQPTLLSPEFDDSEVYSGGIVNQCLEHANLMLPSTDYDPLFLMHTHKELEGSREVIKGVRIGGIEAAKKAVAEEEHAPQDFKVFSGFSGWEMGKLMDEVNTRCWFCASVSPSLIFNNRKNNNIDMWHEMLEAMGGECRSISLAVREMFREAVLSQEMEGRMDLLQ